MKWENNIITVSKRELAILENRATTPYNEYCFVQTSLLQLQSNRKGVLVGVFRCWDVFVGRCMGCVCCVWDGGV